MRGTNSSGKVPSRKCGTTAGRGLCFDEVTDGVAYLALVIGELRFDVQEVYATVWLHTEPSLLHTGGDCSKRRPAS